MSNFSPLSAALGGWLILNHRFTPTFMIGMATALGGAVVLMGESLSVSLDQVLGDVLALITGMLFGIYILVISHLRTRYSTARIMTWTCVFASLALLPTAILTEHGLLATTVAGWAAVIALALIGQAGAQSLLTYSLAHLPATFSAVGYLLVPVNAATFAWIILGESLSWWQVLGATIVLLGIFLARRGSRQSLLR